MKVLFTALFTLIGFISSTQAQTPQATPTTVDNSSSDETAIKQVIADEAQGFITRDQQKWSNGWRHADYVSWSSERSPFQIMGWENMNKTMAYNFVSGLPPRPVLSFQRDNYQVNVVDKIATATFIQTAQASDGKALGKSNEVRVLEKQDNDWKLIYVYSRTIR